MRQSLAIYRAAHFHIYLGFMRDVGAPADRELARSRLPSWIEETPDEYVSLPLSLDWLRACGGDIERMELGFLASSRVALDTVGGPLQRRLAEAQTAFAGVRTFLTAIQMEDSVLHPSMRLEGDDVRAIIDTEALDGHPFLCIVEWHSIYGILLAAGEATGPGRSPREITLQSRLSPPEAAFERWPETRILVGQPHTSVLFDRAALAGPTGRQRTFAAGHGTDVSGDTPWPGWTFAMLLRALIRSYLRDGYPDIATIAEITRTSPRTLQRRLQEDGRSYSDIVQEARFELARDLLSDPSMRIIDVAMMCSYENPQHFSRAFRRTAGVSPRHFRQLMGDRQGGTAAGFAAR